MEYDVIKEGWHELSGFCDCVVKQGYRGDINGLIVRLDGKNYRCYKDSDDGYRSHSEFEETEQECTNTFPPQRVMVIRYDRASDAGIKIYNPDFELILLVGTDDYDDYYPMAVWEWHPENLPINKGVHKPGYTMPGELTMKIKDALCGSEVPASDVMDIIDQYYRKAYRKGADDMVKTLEDVIGDLDEYGTGTHLGHYVTALEGVIEELQRVDPTFTANK